MVAMSLVVSISALLCSLLIRSFIYVIKSLGSMTEPCGTPLVTGIHSDVLLPRITPLLYIGYEGFNTG